MEQLFWIRKCHSPTESAMKHLGVAGSTQIQVFVIGVAPSLCSAWKRKVLWNACTTSLPESILISTVVGSGWVLMLLGIRDKER